MEAKEKNALKDNLQKHLEAGYTAQGSEFKDRDARNLGIAKGMKLHPIYNGVADVKVNVVETDGNRNAFHYLETEEGVRISATQITRRGSGIALEGEKELDRFTDFLSKLEDAKADKKTCTLDVVGLYGREMPNGQVSRSAIFRMAIA